MFMGIGVYLVINASEITTDTEQQQQKKLNRKAENYR